MVARLLVCTCFVLLPWLAVAQPSVQLVEPDGVTQLLFALQKATEAGDGDAIRARIAPDVRVASVSEFVQSLTFPRAVQSAIDRTRGPLA